MILFNLCVHGRQIMAVSALEPSSTDFLLSMNEKPTQRQIKSQEKNSVNQKL